MAEELKACPFCGDRDPEIVHTRLGIYLACTTGDDCTARGPSRDTESEAIAAWNHRAIPPDHETEIARRVREAVAAEREACAALMEIMNQDEDTVAPILLLPVRLLGRKFRAAAIRARITEELK